VTNNLASLLHLNSAVTPARYMIIDRLQNLSKVFYMHEFILKLITEIETIAMKWSLSSDLDESDNIQCEERVLRKTPGISAGW
jgi:hypothetical protein